MFWANQFSDIPEVLRANDVLRECMVDLICSRPCSGKVTQGGSRLKRMRETLCDFALDHLDLNGVISRLDVELCESSSPYKGNRRVFCEKWAERLARTQIARFYSQAVIAILIDAGETHAIVPHSSEEDSDSKCSKYLAGGKHSLLKLHADLIKSYEEGQQSLQPKIPDHPHCTHVVRPLPHAERLHTRLQTAGAAH